MLACDQALEAPWVGKSPDDDLPFDEGEEEPVGACSECGDAIYAAEGYYEIGDVLLCDYSGCISAYMLRFYLGG